MSNGTWATYVTALLDARGERAADLAKATGISNSLISRWLSAGTQPDIPSLRRLAATTGIPLLELMIQAGHITRDEAQITRHYAMPRVTIERAIDSDDSISDHDRRILHAILGVIRGELDPWARRGGSRSSIPAATRSAPSPA